MNDYLISAHSDFEQKSFFITTSVENKITGEVTVVDTQQLSKPEFDTMTQEEFQSHFEFFKQLFVSKH